MVRIMDNLRDIIDHCRKEQLNESVITTKITDMNNKVIAMMLDGDDFIELQTPMNKALGRYIKSTNTTVDMMNKALAKGNVLVTLIKNQ